MVQFLGGVSLFYFVNVLFLEYWVPELVEGPSPTIRPFDKLRDLRDFCRKGIITLSCYFKTLRKGLQTPSCISVF